jgi:hypothetical protein
MDQLVEENKLCCLMKGQRCAWCPIYFGCCNSYVAADRGDLLCDTCWPIYERIPKLEDVYSGFELRVAKYNPNGK